MSPHLQSDFVIRLAVGVARFLILAFGGLITYFAYKAYRRAGIESLRYLTLGFGFVVLGSLIGGATHILVGVDIVVGILVDSIITAFGFIVVSYSLYTTDIF